MTKCEVCLTDFSFYDTGHFLHPTNWSARNKRTADVCSTDCRDLFLKKIHAELDLDVVETLIRNKKIKNDDVQKLHSIREVLDNPNLTAYDKLEEIEEMFFSHTDSGGGN